MAITVGDAILRMRVDKGSFDRDINSAQKLVKDRMGKMQASLKATSASFLKIGRTAGIMAGIGAGAIGVMVKSAAAFDKAMREVNTLVGLSEEQMGEMRAEVKALSVEMGIDAVEASKALYQAISAGQEPTEALEFLNVAARTAIGGITSLETATTGLTSIMNAFGIEAAEAESVADVLFVSMKGGITTIDELSTSFFQVAPVAAALGVSFEEVAAAATTITKSGTPTKIAFTSLRQAIVALAKPTTEMSDLLRVLGFESGTAALEALGLQGTFQALATETGATQEELIKAIGSIEAMQAVFGITGLQAEEFGRQLDAVQNATGASQAAFEEMAESASFKFAQAQQSMQALRRELGEAMLPAVIAIMNALQKMLAPVTEWIQKNPELAKWVGIITVGLVAFVAGIAAAGLAIGAVTGGIAALIGMMTTLRVKMIAVKLATWAVTAAQWLWNIAMTANPIGLIVIAIAALVAGLVLLVKNIDKVTAALGGWQSSIEKVVDASKALEDTPVNLKSKWKAFHEGRGRQEKELAERIRRNSAIIRTVAEDTVVNLKSKWKAFHEGRGRQEKELAERIRRGNIIIRTSTEDLVVNLKSKWKAYHEMRGRQEEERIAAAEFMQMIAEVQFENTIRQAREAAEETARIAREEADARIREFQRANDVMGIIRDRTAEALKTRERERARERLAEALTPEERAQALLSLGRLRAQVFQRGPRELQRAGGLPELGLPGGNMLAVLQRLDLGGLAERTGEMVEELIGIFKRLFEQGRVLIGGQPIAMGGPESLAGLPVFAHGGVIPEPTLLVGLRSMRPYAVAGEAGREFVVPEGASGGFRTANISFYVDGRMMARVIGQPLVDEIRLRQAVRA